MTPAATERGGSMLNVVRWVIILGLTLVVLGLIAYARGPEHQRGDDVGALDRGVAAARV
jgi:hypothetical protein